MDHLQTLHQFLEYQAENNPQRTAVIFNHQSLNYEQLNQKANQLAHYLIRKGIQKETPLAVYLERSFDFLITVLGILKAGCAYIPLDITYPRERILLILKEAGNPLLITTECHKKKLSLNGNALVITDNKDIKKQSVSNPSIEMSEKNLAYVIYTSGSTGVPKGVLIEHQAIVNYCLWFSQQHKDISRIDFSSNHAFDMSITLYLVPLILGLTVIMCEDPIKKDPKKYINYLNAFAIDFIKITPSYFKILVHEMENKFIQLPFLKELMLGGENLTKQECASWLKLYPHHVIYNEYGPTETTVAVTAFSINKSNINDFEKNIPIGRLALNTDAYILNDQLQPVVKNEIGELFIGGRALARGYLNSPELTEKYFIKNPFTQNPGDRLYKTGDLCRLNTTGNFECMGRIDHQIKIRGFRVEPSEIESYLMNYPDIKAAIVNVYQLNQKENSLIAYYIPKNSTMKLQPKTLRQYLKNYLPDYMIPSVFIEMELFPLNANDKLDRAALPMPQFKVKENTNYTKVRNSLRGKLMAIWSEELGINPIGIEDDFFELGGHSLSAARIISKINKEFCLELSLQDIYTHTTIGSLIPIIKKAKKIIKDDNLIANNLNVDTGLLPLSDFQFMLWIANTFEPKAKKLNIISRKRFDGRFDVKKLNKAYVALLNKHEALSYRTARFRPGQYLLKNNSSVIVERSLELLSDSQKEELLNESIQELMNYSLWPKNAPQIIIRLFYLNENCSELQLCIPHIISDDLVPDILLYDLSQFYSAKKISNKIQDHSYRDYILDEQIHLKKYLNRDISFWDEYLKDANLYAFPEEYIVKDMHTKNYSYSTYIDISPENLNDLNAFCARKHISILDGLCAIVALALKKFSSEKSTSVCINRVKSTRESQDYDNTIGCFLRIEPVKLALHEQSNVMELSRAIHQAAINTHPYQGCPNLIKLASISSFRNETNFVKKTIIKSFFWLYSLLSQVKLYSETLKFIDRLNSIRGNNFLININVQGNFVKDLNKEPVELFGFKIRTHPEYQYDLLNINNVFDVNFLHTTHSKNSFIVISANLEPTFRKKVGEEMIRIIEEDLVTIE